MNIQSDHLSTLESPYRFEKNLGQHFDDSEFFVKYGSYMLFFLKDKITIGVINPFSEYELNSHINNLKSPKYLFSNPICNPVINFINLSFINFNSNVKLTGEDILPSKSNYFGHNLPKEGISSVPTFSKIKYTEIYNNIDLIFYFNEGLLEYDFIVKPGGNPNDIKFKFEGHENIKLDENGNIVISIGTSNFKIIKPSSYQIVDNFKNSIKSNFILNANEVLIDIDNYVNSIDLIIDPIFFFSTYLGGDAQTFGKAIAVDSSGSSYVTSYTSSSNFPITNPIIGSPYNGTFAIYVTKFDSTGNLVYSTYINGDGDDQSYGIAVDLYNNVYITGYTTSFDFPTTFNQGLNPDGNKALFVTKLDSTGGNILYSVYIHGDGNDWGYAIALDSDDNAYITGNTTSSNYPSTYTVLTGNKNAVFITKIDSTGTNLPYSVYIDGNGDDWGLGIDVNALSEAYITGYTYSSDFPVTNKLGPNNLSNASASVYIIKVNDLGTALPYSAYIHGNSFDIGYDIALDSSSNAYITGYTQSTNFPANQLGANTLSGSPSVFVTKINSNLSSLLYSSYIHGNGSDIAFAIDLDASNNAYITGYTSSLNFPTTLNIGPNSPNYGLAVFITEISSSGSSIPFSAYIHGNLFEIGFGIAVDNFNNIYATGYTGSSNFPTTRAYDSTLTGFTDAFVLKFSTQDDLLELIYDELTNPVYGLEAINNNFSTLAKFAWDLKFDNMKIQDELDCMNCKLNCILKILKCNK